jgi:DNA-binding GntR family transcriptional regulator
VNNFSLALGPVQPAVSRQTAPQAVATALRAAILTGALSAGTRLIQAQLAAYFGVSSTPVREALRQLAAEGLVRFDSYRGAVVITSTPEDVREVWELMMVLQPIALRKAVKRVTADELAELRRINDEMSAETDVNRWIRLNGDYHQLLHETTHSPFLVATLKSLLEVAGFHTAIAVRELDSDRAVSNQEHADILAAIEARDADLAIAVIERQLRRSFAVLEPQLTPTA